MKFYTYCFGILTLLLPLFSTAQDQRGFKPVDVNIDGTLTTLYTGSFALLIGVSDYDYWPDLPGVLDDLNEVENVLEEHGFQVKKIINPDDNQLQGAYEDFIDAYGMDVNNRLLIYFAGHGHTIKSSYGDEMGYIVPKNAPLPTKDQRGFMKDALSMQQMEVWAKGIQSKHALFMFDACFSGSLFALSRAVPEVISYKTTQHVRQFITSGAADEEVPDISIYRKQFVDALRSDIADGNGDHFLTGTELGEFIQSTVVNYSRNGQHPQYGKIRHPSLDKGDFVFILKSYELSGNTPVSTNNQNRNIEVDQTSLANFGAVEITSQLEGDLYLDSKKIQYLTPNTVTVLRNLPPGKHYLKITGNENWETAVDVKANETISLYAKSKTSLKADNKWILVDGGSFKMGSDDGEANEKPVHRVRVSDFDMKQHEVSNAEFADFLNLYGSDKVKMGKYEGELLAIGHETGLKKTSDGWAPQPGFEQNPVINVSWYGANEYCKYINGRLPTEAEWEYAAKGGKTMRGNGNTYSGSDMAGEVAWYYDNANNRTNRIMTKNPNQLDIYDMSGNVWEWCSDYYDDNYYNNSPGNNPQGPQSGIYKVMRGGSWSFKKDFSTTTYRNKTHPGSTYYDVGFRCVREAGK
nr:SUMF1/EgtB/PvdO family nonheme iron enzyme [Bacteroidota bacterium]